MQKIIIRNFRQITHAEVEIKNLLVLVGEQASGKSTLAKLIYFFKGLQNSYLMFLTINTGKKLDNIKQEYFNSIENKFKIYFNDTNELNDNFELIYYYQYFGENNSNNIYIKVTKNMLLSKNFENNFIDNLVNNTINLFRSIVESHILQQSLNELDSIIFESTQKLKVSILIDNTNKIFNTHTNSNLAPAGRSITVAYPEQFQSLFLSNISTNNNQPNSIDLELMKEFIFHSKRLYDYYKGKEISTQIRSNSGNEVAENCLNFFLNHTEYILQGKYSNADGYERIVYDKEIKGTPLTNASSGQQEVVRIIQDLLRILVENEASCRIIEEPEAHLYPKAQKNLLELMALIINKTNSQIIITTHSPYILSIINNLLMYSVVAENNPAALDKIAGHFGTIHLNSNDNEKINLTTAQIQAYALNRHEGNYCTSVIDAETGLIGENYLDAITEELNEDFNTLYHLNFQKQ